MTLHQLIAAYLVLINLIAFCAMGIDKRRAKRDAWRVRESTLFILAAIGGSIGAIAGMRLFRHKTKHRTFTIGLHAILILQLALSAYIVYIALR